MTLTSLGYIGINSARTQDWTNFATDLLGMQKTDTAASVAAFRMDDRKQRLIVTNETRDGLAFLGWEVASSADLDRLATRLENAGIEVTLEKTTRSAQAALFRALEPKPSAWATRCCT